MENSDRHPIVVSSAHAVNQALRKIGLAPDIVRAIALAAASARADSLKVDPSGAPGMLSYIHGVRAMRLQLLPLGWRESREGNVESAINDDLSVQLCFQNVHIACSSIDPQAISSKGAASRKIVNSGQLDIFEQPTFTTKTGRSPVVWLICVSADDTSIRAEVSCPEAFEGNQFEGFKRRLFVVDESHQQWPTHHQDVDDDGDLELELDIPVTKK